jgi:archaemetzincin
VNEHGPTIAVVPLGRVPRNELQPLLSAVGAAFHRRVELLPTYDLPPDAYDAARAQTRATRLLDLLAEIRLPEHEQVLGVTDVDLYAPELNFVFGEAHARRHVAVFSLERLHSQAPATFRKRAATEAIHELGHAYGLAHCDDPNCVMYFSNTLADTDRKGTHLCRHHAGELRKNRAPVDD